MTNSSFLIIVAFAMSSVAGVASAGDTDRKPADGAAVESFQADGAWGVARSQALAVGRTHAIAGTSAPAAIRAGFDVLKRGGSAADAVMTTALGQIALAAGSWVSYAGFLQMLYFDAATGDVHNLNAAYNTVLGETDPMSIPTPAFVTTGDMRAPPSDDVSGRAVLVPGFMAGIEAASERFGALPFAELFEPAIRIAEQGFEVSDAMAGYIEWRRAVLWRLPEARNTFFKADGSAYRQGDIFRQPALARTLRAVADRGADYMYEGPWARKFVDAVRRDGGRITLEDLRRYEVIWDEPAGTTHGDFDVLTTGLSALGGVNLIEALNLVEAAALPDRAHYAQDGSAFRDLARIINVSGSGGLTGAGSAKSPNERIDKASAVELWRKLEGATATTGAAAGGHSDAIVAVDRQGNVAAIVHTINTVWWGELGMLVDGVSIPDSGSFQQALIQAAGPGKRLPDPTEPVLILRNGKPIFAFSSIAGGLHYHTVTTLVNALDFGMDPKSAIDTPSLLTPVYGSTFAIDKAVVIAGDYDARVLDEARDLGLGVETVDREQAFWRGVGILVGLEIDSASGLLKAAAPYYGPGAAYAR